MSPPIAAAMVLMPCERNNVAHRAWPRFAVLVKYDISAGNRRHVAGRQTAPHPGVIGRQIILRLQGS
jgi:hypothetical protein